MDWSGWYDLKGRVGFKDGIGIRYEHFPDKMGLTPWNLCSSENMDWKNVKRYKIKLDGVYIVDYSKLKNKSLGDLAPIPEEYMLGYDPGNKIILCKSIG